MMVRARSPSVGCDFTSAAHLIEDDANLGQRGMGSLAQRRSAFLGQPLVHGPAKEGESDDREQISGARGKATGDEGFGDRHLPAGLFGQLAAGQRDVVFDDVLSLP